MPDRWTQATEQLVADELRGLVGMQFTDSDADNRAEQILSALADAGLLVPPCSTCGGAGSFKCVAHQAGDGCDEGLIACPDCGQNCPVEEAHRG